MEKEIYQIYDRVFKRIFNLSNLAIVNLINGLFHTNYPPDSTVTYANKEFVDANLGKRLADIIIIIQGMSYHLEAQMEEDDLIVVRVFEYGFHYAMSYRQAENEMHFPEPVIIYLNHGKNVPEKSVLHIIFGNQVSVDYEVKNFVYLEHNIRELNQRKMVILIPFQLLRLWDLIAKKPTEENFELLKSLILDDIIGSVKANLQVGNIADDDANQLIELTRQLYEHIYLHYEEIGGSCDMKPLLEGAMELPMDKYRIRIDELEAQLDANNRKMTEMLTEKDKEIAHLKALLQNKD